MMLTTKARYAVMAVLDLAGSNQDKPVKLATISENQGIALNYLEQIFLKLKRAGVVDSVKGPGGGYNLAIPMQDIRIIQIIDAVEENTAMTNCRKKEVGCISPGLKCRTHDLWEGLSSKIREYLSAITLDDVLKGDYVPKI